MAVAAISERRAAVSEPIPKRPLTLPGLTTGETLEEFDWAFQPCAARRQLETLATQQLRPCDENRSGIKAVAGSFILVPSGRYRTSTFPRRLE